MVSQPQHALMQSMFNEWYHRKFIEPMMADVGWAERYRQIAQEIYFAGYRAGKKHGDGRDTILV